MTTPMQAILSDHDKPRAAPYIWPYPHKTLGQLMEEAQAREAERAERRQAHPHPSSERKAG